MATYPTNIVSFTTHVDGQVVEANDPNLIQVEVAQIESFLGVNPHISTTPSSSGTFTANATTFSSVAARLANIETGVVSDAHTHYVHKSGGDTISPSAGSRGLSIQAPTGQTVETFRILGHGGGTIFSVDASEHLNLTSPFISDFTNAGHTHGSAGQGGTLLQANTHGSPDTDAATTSLHHTIGTGANQAAPGTHPGATTGTHGITGSFVGTSDVQTLSGKTLVLPTIADFTNAGHTHAGLSTGGQLAQANTHGSADTDLATTSLHHTLGTGANQAATGNHTHTQAQSHGSPDTDAATTSLHHTLGTGANQAAAGNHGHTISNISDIGNATVANANHVLSNGAGYATFNWTGQSGQPTYLWGSNDGTTFYVWNPSNFSVNYASSANNANYATTAGSANSVAWGNVSGKPVTQMHFGQVFVTTDGSGFASFAHGMSPAPSSVVITHYTGGGNGGAVFYTITSIDATNVHVRAWLAGTNTTTAYANTSQNFYYIAAQ